ncbi:MULTISPECIES: hypothetical protein [unclassified Streptomyces]|uniref:hypothetical protein n=1 Tax=unclassified Streptomyces TaxID=2593676 RepID=UPI0024412537|nr:hypothetical protein [Streptomyces sp. DH41]MDG9727615.1 hypothetical protein [Streptomyces sp. DH41]
MTDNGGGAGAPVRRSRLADYAEMTRLPEPPETAPEPPEPEAAEVVGVAEVGGTASPGEPDEVVEPSAEEVAARRREFISLLEAFRDTAVLVPLRSDGWLTADFGGVRWILAFSDESALARYAVARDEAHLEWTYQTVLGAKLLDVAVPAAGVPCGVALDAADGTEHAVLLPPVSGVVPDAFAVDRGQRGSETW